MRIPRAVLALAITVFGTLLFVDGSGHIQADDAHCGPQVCLAWERHFPDEADLSALFVDGQEDVYVVIPGIREAVKFNSDGTTAWTFAFPDDFGGGYAPAALDDQGNLYISLNSARSGCAGLDTIQVLGNLGQQGWRSCFADGNSFTAVRVLTDSHQNVYVAARLPYSDYFLIKYNDTGKQQWTYHDLPHESQDYEQVDDAGIDALGNVYMTGVLNSWPLTIKVKPDGGEAWRRLSTGPGAMENGLRGIHVASDGTWYIGGNSPSDEPPAVNDLAAIKYDSAGNESWRRKYSVPPRLTMPFGSGFGAFNVDSEGNLIMTGTTVAGAATVKYDSSGTMLWQAIDCRGGSGRGVAVDGHGGYFLVGDTGPYLHEAMAAAYGPDGVLQWKSLLPVPNGSTAHLNFAVSGASGTLYAAGTDAGSNAVLVKYQPIHRTASASPKAESLDTPPCDELKGDIYCDGVIDAKDALAMMMYIADGTEPGNGICPFVNAPLAARSTGTIDCIDPPRPVDTKLVIPILAYLANVEDPFANPDCDSVGPFHWRSYYG